LKGRIRERRLPLKESYREIDPSFEKLPRERRPPLEESYREAASRRRPPLEESYREIHPSLEKLPRGARHTSRVEYLILNS
jgi:hypothetical protein